MEVLYHAIKTRYAYDFPLCFPHELLMSLRSQIPFWMCQVIRSTRTWGIGPAASTAPPLAIFLFSAARYLGCYANKQVQLLIATSTCGHVAQQNDASNVCTMPVRVFRLAQLHCRQCALVENWLTANGFQLLIIKLSLERFKIKVKREQTQKLLVRHRNYKA